MTKDELIHQVLNEENIDLYNFWAMKLLTEYPEYKVKVCNPLFASSTSIYTKVYINPGKNIITDSYFITSSWNKEGGGYLNWVLRNEGYE